MSIFQSIKTFFNKLFGRKEEVKEEIVSNNSEDSKETEDMAKEPEVSQEIETTETEEPVVKVQEEEQQQLQIFSMSDDDKENIINLIRPIIKSFNTDEAYIAFVETFSSSKTLKTYSSLSDDKKTLTINLTQNSAFNSLIGPFINAIVKPRFESVLNTELGNYKVDVENGSIIISKIG